MAASNTGKMRATDDDSSLPASSSCGNSRLTYEVFLSFRGEDTRNNFTDHLYAALERTGIYTFRDDERLERGKEISPELLEAIERSTISIIILSKNYASSTWCLDELAKIVECMKAEDQTVLPVFYKVDPSHVENQEGDFKTAFDKYEQDFWDNPEKVKRWRSALTQVANLAGWHLHDGSEAKLITEIVDNICRRLNQIQSFPSVDGGLVGIDSRVKEINKRLRPDIPDEIRFVGICGMGGIGKTTIARVVYEWFSYKYEGSCFLANVREVSEKKGLESLQEMLLNEVLKEKDLNICDYYKGINLIRKRLCRKKIFLILDDVDQLEQLERLAGSENWFGSGSRIIITTRDEHVLASHGIYNIYKVAGLDDREAHSLFCLKAFKRKQPTDDHIELLERAVRYAKGLPLALKVLGSSLCDRNVNDWKSELDRLEGDPDQRIMKILRISYDGLKRTEKKIFLDVACFFKGKDVDKIKKILDSCNLYADIGISVLEARSLITIENNKLQIHDLVQGMGWEVVREQHPDEPGKWSRLWLCEDVYRVLARNMGSPTVEAMIPFKCKKDAVHANGKCFSTMSNLRLLNISNVHISEDLQYLSNELRFFKWRGYPLKTLPSSFYPQKLFQLSLCYSSIEYLWNDIKSFRELKIIELCYSRNLIRTPDFTMIPNLERLDLQYCTRLLEVHPSVGSLGKLVELKLNECENLVHFPSNVCGLKSLKILNLHGCSKLHRLPFNLEEMEHLEELDVSGTAIRQVPLSIVQLTNLRTLSLRGCKGPPETWSSFLFSLLLPTRKPDCMGLLLPPLAGLYSLQTLDLSDCNLWEGSIPSDLISLCSLEELNLGGNNFVSLPDSLSQLSKLQILSLKKCHRLESLPKLPPGIIFVGAEECASLKTISNVLDFTSSAIALHFFNCFNLIQTGGWNNGLAIMLLKRYLQIYQMRNHHPFFRKISYNHQFHIRLPGSEIPNLFNCRSEGSVVIGRLPNVWLNDEFIGFAICAVFTLPEHSDGVKISCNITTFYGATFGFNCPDLTTIKSDHLWLGFLSRELFFSLESAGVVAKFLTISDEKESLVKRCGIRPLYKQDVEHLEDLSATDDGISMVQHLYFIRERGSTDKQDVEYLEDLSATDDGSFMVQHLHMICVPSTYYIYMPYRLECSRTIKRYSSPPFGYPECMKWWDEWFRNIPCKKSDTESEDSEANSRETVAGTNSVADESHDD